jgi:hypothetical protein
MAKSKETGKPLISIRFILSIFILCLSGFVIFLFIFHGEKQQNVERPSAGNLIIENPLINNKAIEKEVPKTPNNSLRVETEKKVETKKKIAYAITVTKVYK